MFSQVMISYSYLGGLHLLIMYACSIMFGADLTCLQEKLSIHGYELLIRYTTWSVQSSPANRQKPVSLDFCVTSGTSNPLAMSTEYYTMLLSSFFNVFPFHIPFCVPCIPYSCIPPFSSLHVLLVAVNNLDVYQINCQQLYIAVVLIQISRCKEIYFEQIVRLGSLERTTILFEVSKSCAIKP